MGSNGIEGYSVFDPRSIDEVFTKFDAKIKTKIIIHGWMDDQKSNLNGLIKDSK